MTRHPHDIVWPRRAAVVVEALTVIAAGVVLVTLALAVAALARIEPARPLLAVASGFLAGALARLAKDARRLATTYTNWRRQHLDQLCTQLEVRRTQRRLTTTNTGTD